MCHPFILGIINTSTAITATIKEIKKTSKNDYKSNITVKKPIKIISKKIKEELVKKVTENYKTNVTKKENLEEKVNVEPIVTTQTQEITVGNGYYNRITNYSTSLESAVLKDVSEILSGDQKENRKRTWEWRQRQKEIKKYYKTNKVEYSNNEKKKIEDIINIVESNKYATKNHRRKLNNIYETVRYKGESKLKRFFKRNWKKVVAGGLIVGIAVGSYFGVKAYNDNKVQSFSKNVETRVEYIAEEDVSQPITVDSVVEIDAKEDSVTKTYESSSSAISQSKNETYTVKKGDCLWNIAKKYLREQGVRPNNKIVVEVTNIIAKDNGKAKLGVYKGLEKKEMRNPNLIHPNDKVKISDKVTNYIQQYKQKGDENQ